MKLRRNIRFPVDARRPFVGASDGEHLHLVTLDASREQAQHFALDGDGSIAGPVTSLPLLRVDSIEPGADSCIIVGQPRRNGDRTVIRLAGEEIIWQGTVPIDRPLMVSPKLAVGKDHSFVVWATASKKSVLCIAGVEADSVGEMLQFDFEDFIFDLRAVAAEHTLTVACIHGGNKTSLELLAIADQAMAHRIRIEDATRPVAPSLVLAGGELVLFWVTKPEHELRVQHFDEALQPLGPVNLIAAAYGAEMRDARVFQARDDRLLLSYSTAKASDDWAVISEENEPDRYEPASAYEQFLASYDYRARRADQFQKIEGSYVAYAASGWANDSLLLISEVPDPAISIYQ